MLKGRKAKKRRIKRRWLISFRCSVEHAMMERCFKELKKRTPLRTILTFVFRFWAKTANSHSLRNVLDALMISVSTQIHLSSFLNSLTPRMHFYIR